MPLSLISLLAGNDKISGQLEDNSDSEEKLSSDFPLDVISCWFPVSAWF